MPDQVDSPASVSVAPAMPATMSQLLAVGGYLAIVAVGLFWVLASLWEPTGGRYVMPFGGSVSAEVRLLLIAAVCGGLGSFLHAATSFAGYVGNQRVVSSWLCWYYFRPMIGAALAVVVYFVSRAGLIGGAGDGANVNPYGVAAMSGLAGMFSKQATDKLDEVFTTMFRTNTQTGDAQRSHKLNADSPAIVTITPSTLAAGTTPAQLVISGTRLMQESVVRVNGAPRPGTLDGGRITATLTDDDVRQPGSLSVTITNPDGAVSPPVAVTVT